MKATINGNIREFPDELTVAGLLQAMGSSREGVAVARNDYVVPRGDYETQRLHEGDRIEIIEAVAGG